MEGVTNGSPEGVGALVEENRGSRGGALEAKVPAVTSHGGRAKQVIWLSAQMKVWRNVM